MTPNFDEMLPALIGIGVVLGMSISIVIGSVVWWIVC